MKDIIEIAENRLDTLSDDLIIRRLVSEVTTLREALRQYSEAEARYYRVHENGVLDGAYSLTPVSEHYAKFVRVE